MWCVILECVAQSEKQGDCIHILAYVVIQRILWKTQHSKDVSFVYALADEIFEAKKEQAPE